MSFKSFFFRHSFLKAVMIGMLCGILFVLVKKSVERIWLKPLFKTETLLTEPQLLNVGENSTYDRGNNNLTGKSHYQKASHHNISHNRLSESHRLYRRLKHYAQPFDGVKPLKSLAVVYMVNAPIDSLINLLRRMPFFKGTWALLPNMKHATELSNTLSHMKQEVVALFHFKQRSGEHRLFKSHAKSDITNNLTDKASWHSEIKASEAAFQCKIFIQQQIQKVWAKVPQAIGVIPFLEETFGAYEKEMETLVTHLSCIGAVMIDPVLNVDAHISDHANQEGQTCALADVTMLREEKRGVFFHALQNAFQKKSHVMALYPISEKNLNDIIAIERWARQKKIQLTPLSSSLLWRHDLKGCHSLKPHINDQREIRP